MQFFSYLVSMHHLFPPPGSTTSGLKPDIDVIPLDPWTWSKPDIIRQLTPRPVPPVYGDHVDKPPEPEYMVNQVPYNTGYKPGTLIRMHVPISESSFF